MKKGGTRFHLKRASAAPKERRCGVPCTLLIAAWCLLLFLLLTSSISHEQDQGLKHAERQPWKSLFWGQASRQILLDSVEDDRRMRMNGDQHFGFLDGFMDFRNGNGDHVERKGREKAVDNGIFPRFAAPEESPVGDSGGSQEFSSGGGGGGGEREQDVGVGGGGGNVGPLGSRSSPSPEYNSSKQEENDDGKVDDHFISSVSGDDEKDRAADDPLYDTPPVVLPTGIVYQDLGQTINALQYAEYGAGLLQKSGPAAENTKICLIRNPAGTQYRMISSHLGEFTGQECAGRGLSDARDGESCVADQERCHDALSYGGDIVAELEPGESYLVCQTDASAGTLLCDVACTSQSECFLSGVDSNLCQYDSSVGDYLRRTCPPPINPPTAGLGQHEASIADIELSSSEAVAALNIGGAEVSDASLSSQEDTTTTTTTTTDGIDEDPVAAWRDLPRKLRARLGGEQESSADAEEMAPLTRTTTADGAQVFTVKIVMPDNTIDEVTLAAGAVEEMIIANEEALSSSLSSEAALPKIEVIGGEGEDQVQADVIPTPNGAAEEKPTITLSEERDSDDSESMGGGLPPPVFQTELPQVQAEPRRLKRVGSVMSLEEYKKSMQADQQRRGSKVDLSSVQTHKVRQSDQNYNYAASSHGAKVLASNKEAKGASHILVSDRDKYLRNPCGVEEKFVVLELSEETFVDTLTISNFEFHSSNLKDFELLGSRVHPTKEWISLGKYQAENVRHKQTFSIEDPKLVRYLMVKMLTHWGSEFFCTLSVVEVFGVDVIKSLLDDWIALEEDNGARAQQQGGSNGHKVFQDGNGAANIDGHQSYLSVDADDILHEALQFSEAASGQSGVADFGTGADHGGGGGSAESNGGLYGDDDSSKAGASAGESSSSPSLEILHSLGGKAAGDSVLKILMQRVKALEMNQTLLDLYLGDMNQKYKVMLNELDKDLALVTERLRNETVLTASLAMRLADRESQRKEENLIIERKLAEIASNFTDNLEFMRWQIQSMERREITAILLAFFGMILSALLHLLARCLPGRHLSPGYPMVRAVSGIDGKSLDSLSLSSVCRGTSTFILYLAGGFTILVLSV